jgi:glycine cleavage system aminomethyltransferase T
VHHDALDPAVGELIGVDNIRLRGTSPIRMTNGRTNLETPRPMLAPHVRRSPYFARTEGAGATAYIVYNHMYMPMAYGRDPLLDYEALLNRVTMWDVAAEKQTELRGIEAVEFADYLCTRDLSNLEVGQCRYTFVCDPEGQIMCDPVVLRPLPDVVWLSHGDVDLTLWARGLAIGRDVDVEVSEPPVSPIQVQGPQSLSTLNNLIRDDLTELAYYRCMSTEIAGAPVVISRTGWSGGLGYEVMPLSNSRCLEVWDAIAAAGTEYGILITGPNVSRAVEKGITDTSYALNSGMNPFEAGFGRLVDIGESDFVGKRALQRIRETGVSRKTIGLKTTEEFPFLEEFWPLTGPTNGVVGEVRWATHSYALGCGIGIAVVDHRVELGQSLVVHAAGRDIEAEAVIVPFVTS